MKTLLKLAEMMPYLPDKVKDAIHHVAKDAGAKTDELELHRHAHSEKAAVNGLDPKSRRALKYVSARTQDRDDEIVIPKAINLDEFRKYMHVLVNHNYSLLPVGSDVSIEADDFGIKAMTEYADTGEGTLANIVWALISQGHLKSSSIGFVPTSFTKPGARDWDHVANGLQSAWKEFDKSRAEKSISRIITGGVLLEHSDVSVPCNADAELISVVKTLKLDDKLTKQLGWETLEDGSKLIVPINKGMGSLSADELRQALQNLVAPKQASGEYISCWVSDIYEDHFIYNKGSDMFSQGYTVVGGKAQLVGDVEKVERRTVYLTVDTGASKGFRDRADEKPNPDMPGGSFTACVAIMGKKGHDDESAKKICGAIQADSGEKGLNEAETKTFREVMNKGKSQPCICDECGAEEDAVPGSACSESGCEGMMKPSKMKSKSQSGFLVKDKDGNEHLPTHTNGKPDHRLMGAAWAALHEGYRGNKYEGPDKEDAIKKLRKLYKDEDLTPPGEEKEKCIKVIRPAPSVKILFAPPDPSEIANKVSEAVERALSRRVGKIL